MLLNNYLRVVLSRSRPLSFNSFEKRIYLTKTMSTTAPVVTIQCMSLREYFSAANFKSMVRGFVYEYETPKIVTIHSISSK